MANAHRRSSSRGFSLLELTVATAITAVVVMMAVGVLIQFDRGQALRQKVTEVQGEARAALEWIEADLRHAALGAGSGVIWTSSGANRAARPAVQVFSNLPGATGVVVGDAKAGTDAILLVEAIASSPVAAATAADLASSTGSIDLTNVTGFRVGDRVLIGDYSADAVWGVIATLPAGTTTMTLQGGVNVLPGTPVPVLARAAIVRPARARLYYVSRSDELVRLELTVPRAPVVAGEIASRDVLARGFENLKVGCQLDNQGGEFAPCPSTVSSDGGIVDEAETAFGDFAGSDGPLLTADPGSVSLLRNVQVRVVVRSRTPLAEQQGDPPLALTGASGAQASPVGNATQPYVRRAYRISASTRNTSLGAL